MDKLIYFLKRSKLSIERGNVFEANARGIISTRVKISGANNRVMIGGTLVSCSINIVGRQNTITIGKGCHIAHTEITIIADDSSIELGDGSTINGKPSRECLLLARGEPSTIHIGKDCMLAYGVELRTSDSHKIFDGAGSRINGSANIALGNHVWIGGNSTVLKGVSMADGSIAAAGSLITSGASSGEIIGGNPAKVIKANVSWQR